MRVAGARSEGLQVSEFQRARMLSSAVAVVSEHGYGRMSVARVTHRARLSRRTFYDLFTNREDCFLAVFEEALALVGGRVIAACEGEGGDDWPGRVRVGLCVLLSFLDEEPGLGSVLVIDALGAGPRVLHRRAEVLAGVAGAIDALASGERAPGEHASTSPSSSLSSVMGEGVVGGVFSVIHARMLERSSSSSSSSSSLLGLVGPLMAMIVLPYRGVRGARRELRVTDALVSGSDVAGSGRVRGAVGLGDPGVGVMGDPLVELPMRVTYRTLRVLAAIGEAPGGSNREVADASGINDQGQISKLLWRLQGLGLIENKAVISSGAKHGGEPNAWVLTGLGGEVCAAVIPRPPHPGHASHARTKNTKRESH